MLFITNSVCLKMCIVSLSSVIVIDASYYSPTLTIKLIAMVLESVSTVTIVSIPHVST